MLVLRYMLSIIVTTYKETRTLRQTLRIILSENLPTFEILVVAPDLETRDLIAQEFKRPEVRFIKDKGEGKPTALNLAWQEARGQIMILTDGDVVITPGSLTKLIKTLENASVGAVAGRPISASSRSTILGYWSHWLTEAAHQRRSHLVSRKAYFDCSGYLYAVRKNLIKHIPIQILADDVFITQTIWEAGYQLAYVPEAQVAVSYPTTWKDWLKQKVRSAGGQKQKLTDGQQVFSRSRSFFQEATEGWKLFFIYPQSLKEFWWTILLFGARIYLWLIIFWKLRLKRWNFIVIWQRVESSK